MIDTDKNNDKLRQLFRFSYREHEFLESEAGSDAELEELSNAILQESISGTWVAIADLDAEELEIYSHSDFTTPNELMNTVKSIMVDEWELPLEVVSNPIEKLKDMMAKEGWSFLNGGFTEFEGNHNDSEMFALLEKK